MPRSPVNSAKSPTASSKWHYRVNFLLFVLALCLLSVQELPTSSIIATYSASLQNTISSSLRELQQAQSGVEEDKKLMDMMQLKHEKELVKLQEQLAVVQHELEEERQKSSAKSDVSKEPDKSEVVPPDAGNEEEKVTTKSVRKRKRGSTKKKSGSTGDSDGDKTKLPAKPNTSVRGKRVPEAASAATEEEKDGAKVRGQGKKWMIGHKRSNTSNRQEKTKDVVSNENDDKAIVPVPAQSSTGAVGGEWAQWKDRSILLVHVGRTGGTALRQGTILACEGQKHKEECVQQTTFPSPKAVLAQQLRHLFHKGTVAEEIMQEATTFLFSLRNPVDRIVSVYRYSHPANCNEQNEHSDNKPYGCEIQRSFNDAAYHPERKVYEVYNTCFPSPNMEHFAQSVLPPFPAFDETMTQRQQFACRVRAHNLVLGGKRPVTPAPHMAYNYEHYLKQTIQAYPDKEVFAIRTEHEWEDVQALDVAIGGGESYLNLSRSSDTSDDIISPEAYQKLCCVLKSEINNYQDILNKAVNLNAAAKKEAMDEVRTKCGIMTSWREWRSQCQARLDKAENDRKHKKERLFGSSPAKKKEFLV